MGLEVPQGQISSVCSTKAPCGESGFSGGGCSGPLAEWCVVHTGAHAAACHVAFKAPGALDAPRGRLWRVWQAGSRGQWQLSCDRPLLASSVLAPVISGQRVQDNAAL